LDRLDQVRQMPDLHQRIEAQAPIAPVMIRPRE
jgi:hypothetical protein